MWTLAFWKAAGERAIRTAAQVVILTFGVSTASDVTRLDLLHVDYRAVGLMALGGAVLSVLFSVVGSAVGSNPGPSFGAEQVTDKPIYQPEHAADVDDGEPPVPHLAGRA